MIDFEQHLTNLLDDVAESVHPLSAAPVESSTNVIAAATLGWTAAIASRICSATAR